jgi:hemolysin activation/secretion protein
VDQNPKLRLQTFAENGKFWRLDSSAGKLDEFLPRKGDSRVGMSLTISRLRYTKQMNFHRIKWTEDVDKGWNLSLHASKNISALGASDDRWFLTGSTAMSVGSGWHHLSLKTSVQSYLNSDHQSEEMYGKLNGEYILKPSPLFATVLNGQMDTWINSPRGNQLYLGGLDGLNGLPSAILAGQARFYAGLEQRWFPAIEIGTVVPVFTSFVNAGDVNAQLNDFDPGHAQVVAGFGARLGLSKSVEGVINHFNMGWAVRGPNSGTWSPLISWLAEITL